MKKTILGIVGVIIILAGGYFISHRTAKPTTTATSTSSSALTASNAVLATKTDATLGQYLANASGMALYTYDSDTSGVSNCTGSCLANWPAYQPTSSTASLPAGVSIITRTDNGQKQYAYNGMPLYTFVSDSAGKVTGNGVENFTIAKPAASSSSQPSSSTSTQPTNTSTSSNPYNY